MNKNSQKTLILTGWTITLYVSMEWLFFVTMPSFMSSMALLQRVIVLFLSAFMMLLPVMLLTVILTRVSEKLARVIPALVLSALGLILVDNFTYTLFKVGIVSSSGLGRLGYALGFAGLFLLLLRKIPAWMEGEMGRVLLRSAPALLVVVGISGVAFLTSLREWHMPREAAARSTGQNLPNIILIGIDGVDATHMSAYGYARETTPNIARLAKRALVAENAFSNAGKTGGSLTSLLTGKPSTETRVFFPPDILLGEDAYQHLPGILKRYGYRNVQITMQYYGDAYERNLQDGFDVVNGRMAAQDPLARRIAAIGGGGSAYFAGQMLSRITARLSHIFFIRQMGNPYAEVTEPDYAIHDEQRMAEMFDTLDSSHSPLFLHIHLMDTHGPEFYVPHPFFSNSAEDNKDWNLDYYDDAIRNSDQYINDLFDHLEKTDQRENTLVILYSDHGLNWNTLERVPLILWFPHAEHTGLIQSDIQLLDVGPTILDYLNIQQPTWMSGKSLLAADLPPSRPIFSAIVNDRLLRVTDDRRTWVIDETKIGPPFYQLGAINLIVCNRWYSLRLADGALTDGKVSGSTANCGRQDVPDGKQAAEMIVQYLEDERYDVSALRINLPAQGIQP